VSGELEKGKVNLFFPAKLRRGVPAPQGTGSGTGCPLVRFEAPRARRGDASAELFGGRSAAPASRERAASWRGRERHACGGQAGVGGGMECGGVPCAPGNRSSMAPVRSRHRPAASPAVGWAAREARV